MPTPSEREFTVYRRGEMRELLLARYRNGLRQLVNPETGVPHTEDEIRRSTAHGSRFWTEFDGIDLIALGIQKRSEFLAQQMRIDRSGHAYLVDYHGALWGEVPLPAAGASGIVLARGTPGTTWLGSTTLGDPSAHFAIDQQGLRFQVLVSATADVDGDAEVLLVGIDGGAATNIESGAELSWGNPPPGSAPTCVVGADDFIGGLDAEDDAAFASRLQARVRHKPAAGNWAWFRDKARSATVGVGDAFVYPCAFNAGSVLVVPVQRRSVVGPTARLPVAGTLSAVTALLVPPTSPVVPGEVDVRVIAPQPLSNHATVKLSLLKGSPSGWTDVTPFPPANNGFGAVAITLISTQQDFRITNLLGAGLLPGGVSGPLAGLHLMVWHEAESRFESLDVSFVTDMGAGVYRVQLSTPPQIPLVLGEYVSPDMARRDAVGNAYVEYIDSLGPGEVVNLTTDPRASRAYRNPQPSEEATYLAGQAMISFISDALGAPLANAQVLGLLLPTLPLPADPIDGPFLHVQGRFAVYPLD